MKIAVLSGKGGTGKTTVSASLALSVDRCQYADCDVEEPNGWIFLKPQIKDTIPVNVLVPEADPSKCNGCGNCGKACQFNAIAVVKGKVLVFPEICHQEMKQIVFVSGKIDDVISKLEKGTLEGGESLCKPGAGRGYGVEKTVCDHPHE